MCLPHQFARRRQRSGMCACPTHFLNVEVIVSGAASQVASRARRFGASLLSQYFTCSFCWLCGNVCGWSLQTVGACPGGSSPQAGSLENSDTLFLLLPWLRRVAFLPGWGMEHWKEAFFYNNGMVMFFSKAPLPSMVFQWFYHPWIITIECFLQINH